MRWALAALAAVLWSPAASAHAFAERYDLPLPLWHYLTGAGAAVALSFVVAALFLRREPKSPMVLRIALPAMAVRLAGAALPTFGLFAFLALLLAGFFGEQGDWDSNPLPVTVWVLWWVGLAFVSAFLGNVWPQLDPWRTIGRRLPERPPFAWPARLGAWPAVALFFLFACLELAWTENAVPFKLATVILVYSLATLAGMGLFGVTAWRGNADPFARFFRLFACFAPLRIGNGSLILRPPGAGLAGQGLPDAAGCAFVVLMISTVFFDGLSETPLWESFMGAAGQLLYAAGLTQLVGYTAAHSLIKILGLLATPLVFAAIYLLVCAVMGRVSGDAPGIAARRYILTLVPIAIAYHLAHYLSYLLIQGQAIIPLLSDPFGRGWDLFGTRAREIDIGVVSMKFVWLFAVAAIVTGHVASIALAHIEGFRTDPPPHVCASRALIAQLPMVIFMVAFTMLSLWILSQPIVEI